MTTRGVRLIAHHTRGGSRRGGRRGVQCGSSLIAAAVSTVRRDNLATSPHHEGDRMKVDADGAGLDESRLGWIADHLRNRYVDPGKIAGAQVAVVRGGVLGYLESFGVQDRERAVPVADDTIWRLYSMTKPITGVAIMT